MVLSVGRWCWGRGGGAGAVIMSGRRVMFSLRLNDGSCWMVAVIT